MFSKDLGKHLLFLSWIFKIVASYVPISNVWNAIFKSNDQVKQDLFLKQTLGMRLNSN